MDAKISVKQDAYLKVSNSSRNKYLLAFIYLIYDQKRFLDPELTLDAIASELNVSKGHLSRTINNELGMGFSDYVNSLRVNEAKSQLKDLMNMSDHPLAIGLKSGFNSKTTFYAVFKKWTGSTPQEFRNKHQMSPI
ncbi:MAG: helix-turn-helix domain-containing protein [Gelidibacter sp.]